jgi:prepilin-type N-terminal cleavage/methylation domain-containing protein
MVLGPVEGHKGMRSVCEVVEYFEGIEGDDPIADANARLIAAAPELLATCEETIRYREQYGDCDIPGCPQCQHFRRVRAAIAKARRGFTLVELLVVILIIALVSVVALPTIVTSYRHRQTSEAARLVQAAFAGARDEAIRTNRPSGIRLLPDPAFSGIDPETGQLDPTRIMAASRLVPIGPAPSYSEGALSIYPDGAGGSSQYPPAIRTVMAPGGQVVAGAPCLVLEQAVANPQGAPNPPTSWFWNVRVGDRIQVGNAGPWYTICGPMAQANPELFVNIGPPGTALPTLVGGMPCEYLLLVNGRDDNANGWVDEGFDGVDNNGNGQIDEAAEWEGERWLGSIGP